MYRLLWVGDMTLMKPNNILEKKTGIHGNNASSNHLILDLKYKFLVNLLILQCNTIDFSTRM